ncbi:protein-L-isoaspartate(D-aspartate) O-methyltransferase [Hyphomicrobium sp.]|uniref:protein-L-isoaspartate(D-aspartate) O-methyltransferase n=1 Tax=Hyphomicrobium sp. TaxID=82 RepID=UPI0025C58E5A|nr:protein-L-isoaspartate(D-aspartate) O-methyltransferase [Hyphomicrobium sp.]MCC7250568.1 protein-L-isoaspartate(D-aspartate) O-methyltransferase [Hyphomicrobium sp.]
MATSENKLRERFVSEQIEARGVRDPRVLAAMRKVPREQFVPEHLKGEAHADSPLPIGGGQTISQPYIVAFMIEALALRGGEKVLEIGAGSGYAAAVLAEIAGEVFTIERIGQLAERAATSLADAGYTNVHVRHADGTEGWSDEAPFDAILVSAGAPDVPQSLMRQLAVGGYMVIPVGSDPRAQELIRITRVDEDEYEREDIADVRFVPLIGKEGWESKDSDWETKPPRVIQSRPAVSMSTPGLIARDGETFVDPAKARLGPLLRRIGDARVVLIGEATHGTSEFYRIRARITQELIRRKGFNIVAIEADWPDAARIDNHVRHRHIPRAEWTAFARFPTWMWRNEETREFIDWLHDRNAPLAPDERAAFYGLDLYSLYGSIRSVIHYLEGVDPDLAAVARQRYGCLTPWESDPSAYGQATLSGAYRKCEQDVVHMLVELLRKERDYGEKDGERFFDASQNARLVSNAERYYRTMYYGSRASWNLRDSHMFETLKNLLDHHGATSKAVVWAHNSHIGDASATEMGRRGEHNIGQLCREHFGEQSYRIGLGTNEGTVAAASNWDAPMQVMTVRPAHPQSYERLFHLTNAPGLILPLPRKARSDLREKLVKPRLERAIGVVYRPESELASHYFEAVLPRQFDEYVWIDRTTAITPFDTAQLAGLPDTYPFGL